MSFLVFKEELEIKKESPCPLDGLWVCNKKNEILGSIYYDEKWKCFVFAPESDTKWSSSCLKEIQKKMEWLEIQKRGLKQFGVK